MLRLLLLLLCLSQASLCDHQGVVSFLGGEDNRELEVQVSSDQLASYLKTMQTVPEGAALITQYDEGSQSSDGIETYASAESMPRSEKIVPAMRLEPRTGEDRPEAYYPYFFNQAASTYGTQGQGSGASVGSKSAAYPEEDYESSQPQGYQSQKQTPSYYEDEEDTSYSRDAYRDAPPPPPTAAPLSAAKVRSKARRTETKPKTKVPTYRGLTPDTSYSQQTPPKGSKYGYKKEDQMDIRSMREILMNLMKQVENLQAKSDSDSVSFSSRRDNRDFRPLPTDYLDMQSKAPYRAAVVPTSPFGDGYGAYKQSPPEMKPKPVYLKTSDLMKLLSSASEALPKGVRPAYPMPMGPVPMPSIQMPVKVPMFPPPMPSMYPVSPYGYGGGYGYPGMYPMMSNLIPQASPYGPPMAKEGDKPCPLLGPH